MTAIDKINPSAINTATAITSDASLAIATTEFVHNVVTANVYIPPAIVTQPTADSSANAATTAFVHNVVTANAYVAPTITTQATIDNSVAVATTAFVHNVVTANIPTFSSLTSKPTTVAGYGITDIGQYIFAAGIRMPFAMASAPVGWTQDTSDNANNRMLRVVNTAGGGIGGSHSPVLNNVVPAHTHGLTTGGASANHVHYDSGHVHNSNAGTNGSFGNAGSGVPLYGNANTGIGYASLGGYSADHSHSGATDNGSSQTNWTPRYIDLIICTKN